MKPRNKYEKRVAELNATLSEDIALTNVVWAKEASKNWNMQNFCYFTICSNMCEFEVKRLYRIYKMKDKNTDHFFFVEIIREFNDGEKKTYFAKQRQMGLYYDCFTYSSEIVLRSVYMNYSGYTIADLFGLTMDYVNEDNTSERIPCVRINPKEIGRVVRDNPVAETLYKNNDQLFYHLLYTSHVKELCRAITLAKRHGFVFNKQNTSLWFDMVNAIIYCDYDWHSPKYIAPENLLATHDRFIRMMERKREEKRLREEYERIQAQLERDKTINAQYIKRRKRFYDMVLSDGLIECRVLRDVNDFKDEGMAMKHCVFKCRYYEKPYSLILSARIGGERIETIEVDLVDYTIKQCYGKHDQFTIHHQRILDLVNSQMGTIKAYNKKRNTKIKIAV